MEIIVPTPKAQIVLNRFIYSNISTIGALNIDGGIFSCFTLEDTVRRIKEFGHTAIPAGNYKIALMKSPKFGFCPHILDVPYFTDILIHSGNAPSDTNGCILVGRYNKDHENWVGESRNTFKALMEVLKPMSEKEELRIEVHGGLTKEQMGITVA